jgi:hypothetical protein
MRRPPVLVFFLLLFLVGSALTACQSKPPASQQAGSASSAAESAAVVPEQPAPSDAKLGDMTGVFDDRVEAAMKTLFSNVAVICVRELTLEASESESKACPTRKAIMALDPTGAALEHCFVDDDVEASLKCTVMGGLLMKSRSASGTPVSASAWSDLDALLVREITVLGIDDVYTCTKEGKSEGEAARACQADRFAERFDFSAADGRACLKLPDEWDFSKCLGEAAALGLFEAAAQRSGQLGA